MTDRAPAGRRLAVVLAALAVVVTAVCALGIGVRSTYGGRAAVDEPEYLLTALSLGEDGDLDVADELRQERWRAFHDAELPVQTATLAGGRRVSPHDPLLPVLLALPMRWGGFVAAKAALAALAGVLAALTCWIAVRRLGVRLTVAAPVVGLLASSPPLSVYATQVYPELPAALVTTAAVAALTGRLQRGAVVAVGLTVTTLPWLSVKYVPVAAVLAAVALARLLRRGDRPAAVALGGALTVMAAGYLVAHRVLYGGWTSYATGDDFEGAGEFAVVGNAPHLGGRATRLVGLLLDRGFGIAPWQPAWLLVVPAVVGAVAARRRWAPELLLPLAAGWLTATFVALTAHGYWSPGRQVVVVLPLAALLVCDWAARGRARLAATLAAAGVGAATFGLLLRDGNAEDVTWVTRFEKVRSPAYQALRVALPDYREPGAATWAMHVLWVVTLSVVAMSAWRGARHPDARAVSTRWRALLLVGVVSLAAVGGITDDGSDVRDDDGHQDSPSARSRQQ